MADLLADLAVAGRQLRWFPDVLQSRYAGVARSIKDWRVSYANDAEMATALADLERRITAAQSGRVSQVRIQSTKGV